MSDDWVLATADEMAATSDLGGGLADALKCPPPPAITGKVIQAHASGPREVKKKGIPTQYN